MQGRYGIVMGVMVATLALAVCKRDRSGSGDATETDDGFDKKALLRSIGENVVWEGARRFQTQTDVLSEKVTAYCAALASADPAIAAQDDTRTAWKAAMNVWQELEMMQFGPAAMNAATIRNDIYAWPNISACGIDREVVKASASTTYVLDENDNRKGLAAAEYLLWDDDLTHGCTVSVTETIGWNEKPESERRAARCHYLEVVLADLESASTKFADAWDPAKGDYITELSEGDAYASPREAVNAITDALFYLDKEVKDMKVAQPAGISDKCTTDSCPELVEHPYADFGRESLLANLKGMRAIFSGSPDPTADAEGLDAYLAFFDRHDVAEAFLTALDTAIAHVESETRTMATLATGIDPASCAASSTTDRQVEICAWHADLRAVTDILKTELLTVLDFEAPDRAEGDND